MIFPFVDSRNLCIVVFINLKEGSSFLFDNELPSPNRVIDTDKRRKNVSIVDQIDEESGRSYSPNDLFDNVVFSPSNGSFRDQLTTPAVLENSRQTALMATDNLFRLV